VSAGPPRVLIADGTPASRAQLEAPLRQAGWNVLAVGSSFEVLRAVRDHDDVSVVLIDPDLPGAGVSGVDVVRTLKAAPRFRQVPVFFLLRDGRRAPADVPVDGALELDQLSGAALLEAIRTALRAHGLDDTGEGTAREAPVRAAETAMARYCEDEVRAVVERIVREVAREVVPPIAERLIREEIRRLRREHGFEDPPP
jgi:CheY-like chemotaxis protein